MIDETALSALLREAVDAIEVPEDGLDRVLAARDAGSSSNNDDLEALRWPPHSGPRWDHESRIRAIGIGVAAVVVVVLGVAIAVAHHGGNSTKASSGAAITLPATTAGGASGQSSGASSGAARAAGAGASAGSGGVAAGVPAQTPSTTVPSSSVAPLPTQVIKTGSLSLVVKTGLVPSTVTRLTSLATGLGGYVQNSQSTNSGVAPTATLTLRVPVANFEQLVSQAESYGQVTSVTTSGQDVTAQSVNLAAQIQAVQASINQYLEILTKAESISDILSVQQQIDSLQTQLNQLQGQQKVLNDQTSYSTLSVTITQPAAPAKLPPPPPPTKHGLSKAWAHARRSFTHGIESVVSALGGIAVFVICVGVMVSIGWAGWRVIRRRLV